MEADGLEIRYQSDDPGIYASGTGGRPLPDNARFRQAGQGAVIRPALIFCIEYSEVLSTCARYACHTVSPFPPALFLGRALPCIGASLVRDESL